jgi:hypothetical protein
METNLKYALLMNLPDGKLPGYYAQIVKALASKAPLFDRDKELLIFSSETEREAANAIMAQYSVPYEEMELLLLLSGGSPIRTSPSFSDFGFVSRSGNCYCYAAQTALFRLHSEGPGSEPEQALRQMDEHLLANGLDSAAAWYAVEEHLIELMSGIAKAYGCSIELLHAK